MIPQTKTIIPLPPFEFFHENRGNGMIYLRVVHRASKVFIEGIAEETRKHELRAILLNQLSSRLRRCNPNF